MGGNKEEKVHVSKHMLLIVSGTTIPDHLHVSITRVTSNNRIPYIPPTIVAVPGQVWHLLIEVSVTSLAAHRWKGKNTLF